MTEDNDGPQPFIPISIHIPRVGDDIQPPQPRLDERQVQSTSPGWGRTEQYRAYADEIQISIHIPRVGDDSPLVS